ncbi:DUF3052 family protein [Lentilitoribacter sp. Alg239-R112]|uniref:DUF3052 family protein n=1 Tax=Lentilitoribacter sp. Alg239-R112 TaxID=2305987 RepID=UPI0013A6AC61|nr:DUF3052 family protein [Lentilitoribacter sp. Alg239-R112]
MTIAAAGYSGKPLEAKMGLKDGMSVGFVALPDDLASLTSAMKFEVSERFSEWKELIGISKKFDVIHAFTKSALEIETLLETLQSAIKRDGMVWVSWPKKASKVETDVTEDTIRNKALELDLVDVKVCAVNEIWSGLKLVIRKERR